jgi:hypothetical protein
MALSGEDPRTVGHKKWSVWRLQGLLGSLMGARIAADAVYQVLCLNNRFGPEADICE